MENDQATNNTGATPGASDAPVSNAQGVNDASVQPDAAPAGASAEQPESTSVAAESTAAPQAQTTPVVDTTAETAAAPAPAPVVQTPPPAPVAAPAPVAKPPVAKPAAPAVVKPSATVQPSTLVGGITKYEDVNRVLANVPADKLGIIHFLREYITAMAPRKPVPEKQGGIHQANLYKQIVNLMKNEEEHFKELFTAVLKIVEHEGEGVFAATHAFRFMDSIPLNKDESRAFCNILDMIRHLGPVATRKVAATQIDLNKSLAKGLTETARQRVRSFFGDTI